MADQLFHCADLINEVIRSLDAGDPKQSKWINHLFEAGGQLADLVAAAWPAAEGCDDHSDAAVDLREVLRLHFPDPRAS